MKISTGPDIIVRLARDDVNMPGFDCWPIKKQVTDVLFEAAVYDLLRPEPATKVSRLLYYRAPVRYPDPRLTVPHDLRGRRLFVFDKTEGVNNVWYDLSVTSQVCGFCPFDGLIFGVKMIMC